MRSTTAGLIFFVGTAYGRFNACCRNINCRPNYGSANLDICRGRGHRSVGDYGAAITSK